MTVEATSPTYTVVANVTPVEVLTNAQSAATVPFAPAGAIAATTVAGALAELDAEATAHNASAAAHAGTFVRFAPLPTGVAATDRPAVQAALDAIPATGGRVLLQATTAAGLKYNWGTTGIIVAPQKQVFGSSMRGTVVEYGGTGYAFSVGNQVLGTALAYGCAVGDLSINLTANASSGITLRETAAGALRNVYIEGIPNTTTGTGVFIDAGNTANIFSVLDNVVVNHVKFPHRWGTSGTTPTTSVTAVGCTGFADVIAGSIGLTVDSGNGQGSRWYGGNLENCATAVSNSGFTVNMHGCRFESNTLDVLFNAGAKGNTITDAIDLATVTDNSGNLTNSVKSRSSITGGSTSLRKGETVWLAAPVNKLSIGPDSVLNGQNGVYQNVDVSALIAPGATAVIFSIMARDTANQTNAHLRFRKNGVTTGGINADGSAGRYIANGVYVSYHLIVPVSTAGVFQYQPNGFAVTVGEFYLDVIGYVV